MQQRQIQLSDLTTYHQKVDRFQDLQRIIETEQLSLGRNKQDDAKMFPGFQYQCTLDKLHDRASIITRSIEYIESNSDESARDVRARNHLALLKTEREDIIRQASFIEEKNLAVDYKMDAAERQYFYHLIELTTLTDHLKQLNHDYNFIALRDYAQNWVNHLVNAIQDTIATHEINYPELAPDTRICFAKLKTTCTLVADKKSKIHDVYTRYFALLGCLTIITQEMNDHELASNFQRLLAQRNLTNIKTEDCITAYKQLNIPNYSEQEIITREIKAYDKAKAAFDAALSSHKTSMQPQFNKKYKRMHTIMSTSGQLDTSRHFYTEVYKAATRCLTYTNPDDRANHFAYLLDLSTKIKNEQPESNTREKILAFVGAIVALVGLVLSFPLTLGLTLPALVPAIAPPIGTGVGAAICAFFSYKANTADKKYRGLSKAIIDVHDSLNKIVKPVASEH